MVRGRERASHMAWSPGSPRGTQAQKRPSPAHEVHLAPTEDVQDEALVGVGELHILQEGVLLRLHVHAEAPGPAPDRAPTLYLLP